TITPTTIRDKTECPDVFCPYQESDLFIDATHLCQQRTSGAQNWEAYIKDVRDNHIYRIVQMPSNTWWMAEDLVWDGMPNPSATSYTIRGSSRSCAPHYGCGRFYDNSATGAGAYSGTADSRRTSDVCPAAWELPSLNESCPYHTLENIANVEQGGPDSFGLSLLYCSSSHWTCGDMHTTTVSGNATSLIYASGVRECRDSTNYNGSGCRIVRCVRD
ncbi:MAG: hypothetical protein LBD87_03995, partial [Prevotellaceae bacterium]|nr:hypothetical protein [Prevotellaceae bacterium]